MKKSLRTTSIIGRYVRIADVWNVDFNYLLLKTLFDRNFNFKIETFVTQTVAANPEIASKYVAGTSNEGKNLTVIVLKSKTSKRSVWIDCGIHAREWVSPASCVIFIDNLIAEYKKSPSNSLLSYFEFHIMPCMNPDGYVSRIYQLYSNLINTVYKVL
jgi:murein tripeptide amidase MpaA